MSVGLINSIPIVQISNELGESNRSFDHNSPRSNGHHNTKLDLDISIDRRRSLCQQVQSSLNNLPALFTSNSIQNLTLSDFISLSTANGLNRISSKIVQNHHNRNGSGGNCHQLGFSNLVHNNSKSETNINQAQLYDNRNNSFVGSSMLAIEFNQPTTTKQPEHQSNVPAGTSSRWSRLKDQISPSSKTRKNWGRQFNRLLHFLRVFLTQIFSTTGLCFLVVLYACFGALIFNYLENNNEKTQQTLTILPEPAELANDLWNYTKSLNVFYPDKWKQDVLKQIQLFKDQIVYSVQKNGCGATTTEQWSYPGALLYSVTVITTIGYGNVTCKTDYGRIATILYAIIGIPITFLCLANLGNLMAEAFRFSYRRICCCFFDCFCSSSPNNRHNNLNNNSNKNKLRRKRSNVSRKSKRIRKKSIYQNHNQNNKDNRFPNSVNMPISPTTSLPPKYGDSPMILVCPEKQQLKEQLECRESDYLLRSNQIELLNLDQNGGNRSEMSFVSIPNNDPSQSPKVEIISNQQMILSNHHVENKVENEDDNDINDEDDDDENSYNYNNFDDNKDDKERVPIWLVFCLVVGYIVLGAFMFSLWENWDPIQSAYFCFTTLTTIGFGDLVPGSAKFSDDKDSQTKFVICCIYMMVGLSLIAMSINLVQEEIVIKARRIARRLGLLPDPNLQKKSNNGYDEDEEDDNDDENDEKNNIYINELVNHNNL